MAEKQTTPDEDDDEEAFGHFTFASTSSSSFSHSQQIIAPVPPSNKDIFAADDDEWGDFISPKSENLHSFQMSAEFDSSVPDRAPPDRARSNLVAAKEDGIGGRRALPLSIFREKERNEEDEKRSGAGFDGGELFGGKSGELGKNGSGLGSGIEINDLLASLYPQGSGQIKDGNDQLQNGFNLDRKGSTGKSDNMNEEFNGFSSGGKSYNQTEVNTTDTGKSVFSFSMMSTSGSDGFSSSARSLTQAEVIKVENGRRAKSDDSVFNFLMKSAGSDVFSYGAKPSNAAESAKTVNGWDKSAYELDFDFNTSKLGNYLESTERNIDTNGSWLGTNGLSKSSSAEDNDDDKEWEFQGNTNVTKEHMFNMQQELMSTDTTSEGWKMDSYMSKSSPNEHISSSRKDETREEWVFRGITAPIAKDDFNDEWNFQGNGLLTAKSKNNGVWDFQAVAKPTANDENTGGWGFVNDSNIIVEEDEDSEWEFQVAPVDHYPKQEYDSRMHALGAQGTLRSDTQVTTGKQLNSQTADIIPEIEPDISNPTVGYEPAELDFGFNSFASSTVQGNELLADPISEGNHYKTESEVASFASNGRADAADSYWDFKSSSQETNSKVEVKKADVDQNGALPPSLFSDEPTDSDDFLNQDIFIYNPSQSHSNASKNKDPSGSLSDLILNLYNQVEEKSHPESPQQHVTNISEFIEPVNDSKFSDDDDDFDGTWDFKDAILTSIADGQSSSEVQHSYYTELKMESIVDFYFKLKDRSRLAAISHILSLKEAKSFSEHANKDSEMEALEKKIQDALQELNKADIVLGDVPKNCTPHSSLKEFHEFLREPKFQMLESEYGLSRRLSEAEKELRPAIELVEHATSILSILSMGSIEQQSSYVSAWTEILFVCAQELQHGASIWQHAVEKNIDSQILSQNKGKKFVHALGQIFRVVKVIEVSSKAYRPWILSSSLHTESILTLLKECSTLWSSSGLSDALISLSNSADSGSARDILALLESINEIHELNVPYGPPRHQDSVCGLSMLTAAMIPDVKMVVWDGRQFFLPLANLWANLISSDPPKLPQIHAP